MGFVGDGAEDDAGGFVGGFCSCLGWVGLGVGFGVALGLWVDSGILSTKDR